MDIEEAYKVMQENCGIKEGDTVKVLRKAESGEMGWSNCWSGAMDQFIGMECIVNDIDDKDIAVRNEEIGDWFNFPFFVLEKIEDGVPLPENLSLNSDYDVEFCEDGVIKVGCQTIDFGMIEKIYKTAKSTRE